MWKRTFFLIGILFLSTQMLTLPFRESSAAYAVDLSEKVQPQIDQPSLSLSISPAEVHLGETFTLNIPYHNLGLPYTYIQNSPPGVVDFDPPLSIPCKYDQHSNGRAKLEKGMPSKESISIKTT